MPAGTPGLWANWPAPMRLDALPYSNIWAVDLEFRAEPVKIRAGLPGREGAADGSAIKGVAG